MDCESPGLGPSTETSEFTPTCTLHLAHDHITLSDVDEHEDEDMDPGSIAATRGSEDAASSSQTRDDTHRTATIEEIKIAEEFIRLLKQASLETSGLDANTIHRLHHPIEAPLDIDNPDLLLSIEIFLSVTNASQATYTAVRGAIFHRYPENTILTFDQVKSKIAELSGVVPIIQDMCVNTCLAYTGPFAELDQCPTCGEPRYDTTSNGKKRIARQEFHTIPVGPQLQALWRSREGATAMRHRSRRTHEILERLREHNNQLYEYDDVYHGSAYLKAVLENQIGTDDMVLLMSIDVLDLAPELRYKKKHVLPGGFIPGPHKPKNLDSFLFPGLGHLMALQKDDEHTFRSNPFLAMVTADGPGMAHVNGLVGHHGAQGCRHHKAALLKPVDYEVDGCDHDDVSWRTLTPLSLEQYAENLVYARRKQTVITKPSILSGLSRILLPPTCCALDLMHLASLNIPDLLIPLFRGTLECDKDDDKSEWDWVVLVGEIWQIHGKMVADARPYLPESFDRPPRNPAEKISSGYKAKEFLNYVYGFLPALLRPILPEKYWRNFCKLVLAVRIFHQHKLTSAQLKLAHTTMLEFIEEFELLYYQRLPSRLHFCRPCTHTLGHLGPEVVRLGPLIYYTQWTMERTIGNLGEEIKQPSNPYANLSQLNAVKIMVPHLGVLGEKDNSQDEKTVQLNSGYNLRHPRQKAGQHIRAVGEVNAIRRYMIDHRLLTSMAAKDWDPKLAKWARLGLPNGQIARSVYGEGKRTDENVRMSRNVKYYFQAETGHAQSSALAVIRLYSEPDAIILQRSYNTVWMCHPQGDAALMVVDIENIIAVVGMIPEPFYGGAGAGEQAERSDRFFVVEKTGLEVGLMAGELQSVEND
ncbi:hypothetical protein BKA93DRAFT_861789 [Sparassis latifolia]